MKLLKIKKTSWFKFFFPTADAMTLYPYIFVCPIFFRESSIGEYQATLRHENIHLHQQYKTGLIKFLWKYLTNKEFRYQSELEAYKIDLKFYCDRGEAKNFAAANVARTLSSDLYHNMVTFQRAYSDLLEYIENNRELF
jgi:hypothetical protein